MSIRKFAFVPLALVVLVSAHGVGAAMRESEMPTASTLLKRSVQALHVDHEESTYLMRLIGSSGSEESSRRMQVWFKSPTEHEAKLLIKFTAPANLRNTGFLTVVENGKPADQWLYLPAYNKVRRIQGGNDHESFMGSDFSMADLSVEAEGSFDYKMKGVAPCGNTQCWALEGTLKKDVDPETQPYARKLVLLRKDSYLNQRTEFYTAAGKLEKIMELRKFHKDAAGRWVADKVEVMNLLSKHRTVLEFLKRDVAKVPADHVFTQNYLQRHS